MKLTELLTNLNDNVPMLRDAARSGNLKVLLDLLGPGVRGLILKRGKSGPLTHVRSANRAAFDCGYVRDRPQLARLYEAAKRGQWDPDRDLDWSRTVDPHDLEHEPFPESMNPLRDLPAYRSLPRRRQELQRTDMMTWMLSQFLHGEQGALFAACEVTEAVRWTDCKLYGSTQVVDEGRHVEVFHRYLTTKLEKLYEVNDNLYTIIDALMTDDRWDLKFLGMQIMIEGLALGAFSTLRGVTKEPLLRELLRLVITDEARHVHYGVLALEDHFRTELSPRERREREDWAFEMALLMRNRFLAHELYDEHYAPLMSKKEWNRMMLESEMMGFFRRTMFKRIVPNLKRIGLLSERIRPHYAELGLLQYEAERAAPDLSVAELLAV